MMQAITWLRNIWKRRRSKRKEISPTESRKFTSLTMVRMKKTEKILILKSFLTCFELNSPNKRKEEILD